MNYQEFRNLQEREFKEFTKDKLFNTIDNPEDLKRTLKPFGYDVNDVMCLTDGIYIVKTFEEDFNEFLEQQRRQEHEYILSNLYEVIKYELGEYNPETDPQYTYDSVITHVVGLTHEEVRAYEDVIVKAIDDYKKGLADLN